jgi:hypothetical protein
MVRINIDDLKISFTTDTPLKAFAFLTAVEHYGFDSDLAEKIAQLSYDVYINENIPLNVINVIDYICENYDDLPSDFTELTDIVYNGVAIYNL